MASKPKLEDAHKRPLHSGDYGQLRTLILGDDYESVIRDRLKSNDTERVAEVLPEAIELVSKKDSGLKQHLSPLIESAINESIQTNRQRFVDVIYPAIGPAVRKSVSSALADMIASLNQLLKQSLTVQSIKDRLSARRLGMSYAEFLIIKNLHYRVEQVFFIYKDSGILIGNCTSPDAQTQDPDMVSAMLTAITDFISDSFDTKRTQSELSSIKFGELTVLVETGPKAVIAAAIHGQVTSELERLMQGLNERLHHVYFSELENYNGDNSVFLDLQPQLQKALVKYESSTSTERPWLSIIVLVLLFAGLAYWWGKSLWIDYQVDSVITSIKQREGYQVIDYELDKEKLLVSVIRTPGASPIEQLQAEIDFTPRKLILKNAIAELSELDFFLPRLQQKYGLSFEIEARDEGHLLRAKGVTSSDKLDELRFDPMIARLFTHTDFSKVSEVRTDMEQVYNAQFESLVGDLNNTALYFKLASHEFSDESILELEQVALKLKAIFELEGKASHKVEQFLLLGFADHQGTEVANREVSQKRANQVASWLVSQGVSKELIVPWGVGAKDKVSLNSELQRRVNIMVSYTVNGN